MELYGIGFLVLCAFMFLVGVINRRNGRFPLVKKYGNNYEVYGGEDRGVKYITFAHVMMLDWDVPDEGHKGSECITIATKGEAISILEEFCKENKTMRFKVYETPGGVRAFLTSRCITEGMGTMKETMDWLKCDPLYTRFCLQRREWACRVSPKVGRANDYVARYMMEVGEGCEDKDAVELVAYHDSLIKV